MTNSYLDQAAFCRILKLDKTEGGVRLDDCLLQAMKWKCCSRRNCASVTLESLDELKIVKRDGECFGWSRLYRTVDLGESYGLEESVVSCSSDNSCLLFRQDILARTYITGWLIVAYSTLTNIPHDT